MTQSSVTLGGITLRGTDAYDWELRAGTQPVERLWTLTAEHAEQFRGLLCTPCELVIEGPRQTFRADFIYPLEILPGPNPNLKRLRVADRRWLWSRMWVKADYNIRFATAETWLASDGGLIENAQLQPALRYRKGSLYPPNDPNQVWDAYRVLEHLFGSFLAVPADIRAGFETYEIQDLPLDEPGDAAVDRVLAYLAGAEVFIDVDGKAVVYNSLGPSGGKEILPRLARKQVTGGDIELSDRYEMAPRTFVILFTPEVECRINYREGGSRARDSNEFFPVLPSPDATLALSSGLHVARGTLIEQETAFSLWGVFGFFGEALSFLILRSLGFAAGVLEQAFANNPQAVFDPVAAARIRATLDSWRQLYQIDEQFMGRLESVKAVRATVLNTETANGRAKSKAYCDYTRKPAARGIVKNSSDLNKQSGWAVRGHATLLADAHEAPADVVVLDPTLGVVRVIPKLDPYGYADAVALGYPAKELVPTHTAESDANRTGEDAFAQWLAGPFDDDFELSTVLTAIPGCPNNLDRFHKVELDSSAVGLASSGRGEPLYIRVFPGVMPAKFAWSDANGDAIVRALKGQGKLPADNLVNWKDVDAVALAAARRAAEVFLPRLVGSVDVDMDPSLRPQGPLGSVVHGLFGGATVTRATATAVRVPADIWPYLSASTRRAVLRVLNDGV